MRSSTEESIRVKKIVRPSEETARRMNTLPRLRATVCIRSLRYQQSHRLRTGTGLSAHSRNKRGHQQKGGKGGGFLSEFGELRTDGIESNGDPTRGRSGNW